MLTLIAGGEILMRTSHERLMVMTGDWPLMLLSSSGYEARFFSEFH